ncbi:cation-transporting P-type ATPase [Streptomyces atratus]|uniref:cation-transporting P-type ATPase n=1 Tax=Streptomyces atratus TaxID=1893 RepID=UPI0022521EEA|nr:cation-transporting P-type ATPase [Streptomyces atratus]MCX5338757.1 cation-transporting P-type ATPase [Streptomyces atratus]
MTTSPAGEREPGQELCGLAAPEAERRLAEHGRNEVAEVRSAPLHSRVLAQLRDRAARRRPGPADGLLTRQNLFLPLAVLASALLALAALYASPLRSVLETEPLGWSGAARATAALMSGYLAARMTRNAFREKKAAKAKS